MKAIGQYFPVVLFIMLYNLVLTEGKFVVSSSNLQPNLSLGDDCGKSASVRIRYTATATDQS